MTENADAAARFARAGWPVFPVAADSPDCETPDSCGCKAPLTRNGFKDAETDPKMVSQFWARHPDANVGIATGAPGPTVLDVDVTHGKPGNKSLNTAIRAGLVPSPMAAVRTGSGGSHLYYKGDEQRNAAMAKSGLDLRGAGGYVVAPPSKVHGRPYVVVSHSAEPASIDFGKIRELLEPPQPKPEWQPREGQQQGLGHLAAYMAAADAGGRNDRLFWCAARCVEANDRDALAAVAKAAESTGLESKEISRTIRSAQQVAGSPKAPEREAG